MEEKKPTDQTTKGITLSLIKTYVFQKKASPVPNLVTKQEFFFHF